uniref:Rpn family recombination-promoting nuclease/putative transposase n=1 Tax=Clostridium sp. UBA1652 TaxID=1946348 RepID=UPI00257A191E
DILEIHYLELPKLFESNIKKNEDEDIIQWMMFLETKNKEGFEMLAKKNDKIKKAYSILEVISKDDIKRAAYEAREAELHDQMTRLKSAREEGIKEGIKEATVKNARNFLLMGLDLDIVAKGTGLTIEEVKAIKNELS